MSLREAGIVRAISTIIAVWAAFFAGTVAATGDTLTSKQWQYLMDVPGGKWTWAAAFGVGAVSILVGAFRRQFQLATAGWACVGTASGCIAAFYFLAPLTNPELFTLGYYPWLFCAIFSFIFARLYWSPVEWF